MAENNQSTFVRLAAWWPHVTGAFWVILIFLLPALRAYQSAHPERAAIVGAIIYIAAAHSPTPHFGKEEKTNGPHSDS